MVNPTNLKLSKARHVDTLVTLIEIDSGHLREVAKLMGWAVTLTWFI